MDKEKLIARRKSYEVMIGNHEQDIIELEWLMEKMKQQIAEKQKV